MRMVLKWTRKVLKWLRKVLKFLTPPQSNYALLYISPPIRTQQTPNHSHLSINRSICVYHSTLKYLYARPKMMLLPVLDIKVGVVEGETWNNHWMKTHSKNWFILLFLSTSHSSRYSHSDIPLTRYLNSACRDDASTYLGF